MDSWIKVSKIALLVWSVIILYCGLYYSYFFVFTGTIYGSNFGMLIKLCFLISLIVVWLGIFGITLFLDKKNVLFHKKNITEDQTKKIDNILY